MFMETEVMTQVVYDLAYAHDLPSITHIVAVAARKLAGADGTTFVLRENGQCYYADEDAISPLWKGKRFPMEACISGWSMLHHKEVLIRDIYQDNRIPHDAYRPTFVKSLCMVPIRKNAPIGAIGNYWAQEYVPTKEQVKLLQILADSTAIALENLELKQMIGKRHEKDDGHFRRQKEMESCLYSLAHDLKSPLSTIIGFAELLEAHMKKAHIEGDFNKYVRSIVNTGALLHGQIEKMLMLYSVSTHPIEKLSVDLTGMVQDVMSQMRIQYPMRRINFNVDKNLEADVDPNLMRVVIENLLSNAIKYTRKKETAEISFGEFKKNQKEHIFYVKDNGVGFDSKQATNLFQPLVRLHDEKEFPGTGLGLASAARVIEAHGGTIYAESALHAGATFYITLPSHL